MQNFKKFNEIEFTQNIENDLRTNLLSKDLETD